MNKIIKAKSTRELKNLIRFFKIRFPEADKTELKKFVYSVYIRVN